MQSRNLKRVPRTEYHRVAFGFCKVWRKCCRKARSPGEHETGSRHPRTARHNSQGNCLSFGTPGRQKTIKRSNRHPVRKLDVLEVKVNKNFPICAYQSQVGLLFPLSTNQFSYNDDKIRAEKRTGRCRSESCPACFTSRIQVLVQDDCANNKCKRNEQLNSTGVTFALEAVGGTRSFVDHLSPLLGSPRYTARCQLYKEVKDAVTQKSKRETSFASIYPHTICHVEKNILQCFGWPEGIEEARVLLSWMADGQSCTNAQFLDAILFPCQIRFDRMDGHLVSTGSGSCGCVYTGTLRTLDGVSKKVCFKKNNTSDISWIWLEYQCLRRLNELNIAPWVYGIFVDRHAVRQKYAVVMDLIGDGDTLRYVLERSRKRYPVSTWTFLALELALALRCIHRVKISVNDIKANNVLVKPSSDDRWLKPYIIDFTHARMYNGVGSCKTPDQLIWERVDIYKLGRVITYVAAKAKVTSGKGRLKELSKIGHYAMGSNPRDVVTTECLIERLQELTSDVFEKHTAVEDLP